MKNQSKKIVMAAMFASLCCVATMVIKIPSPLSGYINFGDVIVLLSGWLLSPVYAFCAAGIGSGLADVFSGYMLYAPVTFVIKGLMAIVCGYLYRKAGKKKNALISPIISGVVAELIMIGGYYVFEGFLYGFVPSVVNIPANGIQGIAGIVAGTALLKVFKKVMI